MNQSGEGTTREISDTFDEIKRRKDKFNVEVDLRGVSTIILFVD